MEITFFREVTDVSWLNWATAIGTWGLFGAAFLTIIVALFRPREWWLRPKLRLTITHRAPDSDTFPTSDARWHFFRLRIWNDGRRAAHDVQVFAAKLCRCKSTVAEDGTASDKWPEVQTFMPLHLDWSHFRDVNERDKPAPYNLDVLAPGIYRHCNLAYIRRDGHSDTTRMQVTTMVEPSNKGSVLKPGTHRLEIWVSSAETKPIKTVVQIHFSGRWDNQHLDVSKETDVHVVC